MAAVVPLVGAFIAGGSTIAGVGAALATTSGFAAFASVAGGIMAGVGMLTKNKTLTKIGSLLGVAGAATSLASSLSEGASSAWGGTGEAAGTEAGIAESAAGSDAAQFGKYAKPADQLGSLGEAAAAPVGSQASQLAGGTAAGGQPLALDTSSTNLMDQARFAKTIPLDQPSGLVSDAQYAQAATSSGEAPSFLMGAGTESSMGKLAEAGMGIKDKTTLDTLLDKLSGAGQWAGDKLKSATEFIEKNPASAKIAGDVLRGGMQMYASNDATNQQLNLLAQRRARLNNPVVLGIQTPQLNTFTPGG